MMDLSFRSDKDYAG